jgi:hypothetical protein
VGEIIPSQIVGLSDIEVTNVPCSSEGRGTEANKRNISGIHLKNPQKFRNHGIELELRYRWKVVLM